MTKEELRQYRMIEKEMCGLDDEILYWRTKAMKCTRTPSMAPTYGGSHDPYPFIVDKLTEIEALLRGRYDELAALRLRIETAIEGLESRERRLIRLRYIEGWAWERIAAEIGYEWAQVHRIHGRILQKMIHNDTDNLI